MNNGRLRKQNGDVAALAKGSVDAPGSMRDDTVSHEPLTTMRRSLSRS
jgi:hypothetical protein